MFYYRILIFSIYCDWRGVWAWVCTFPSLWIILQALLAFRVNIEKCYHNRSVSIYYLVFFSCRLNILSLFCAFSVLITMYQGDFLFWSSLFVILYGLCAFLSIYFFTSGKFSFSIFLKIFSEPEMFLLPLFKLIFDFFFRFLNFLEVLYSEIPKFSIFFYWGIHFFSCTFNDWDFSLLSFVFCGWGISLRLLYNYLNILILESLSLGFLFFHFKALNNFVHFLLLFVCF